MKRTGSAWLMLLLVSLAGCDRARRYPVATPAKPKNVPIAPLVLEETPWAETTPNKDAPIVFVHSSALEWKNLQGYWNISPHPVLGSRTLHLGQTALGAVIALEAALPGEAIKIQVPLGLPDPNPYLPAGNPPTLSQWQLGKDLFHERALKERKDYFSCADCHQPGRSFADDHGQRAVMGINGLGLVNSVYNRRQFWDGRVEHLEEVLVRPVAKGANPAAHHVWLGLVESVLKQEKYRARFHQIYGLHHPTQDAAARALATYVRTLLRGHSLYDLADQLRGKEATLTAAHLEPFLNDRALTTLDRLDKGNKADAKKKQDVAQEWALGYQVFRGKGLCATCHSGPLFSDGDYHNLGIGGSAKADGGRFPHLPVGMKDGRFQGAVRTPTLRNLLQTGPYFHDGGYLDLRQVVKHYSDGIFYNQHLAKVFLDADEEVKGLRLSVEEIDALVVFLRSLEGEALDPFVAGDQGGKK